MGLFDAFEYVPNLSTERLNLSEGWISMKAKRMAISLFVAALCGVFCAYGTSTVQIPGFQVTMPYLLTIFYSRLLIGLVVGLAENIRLIRIELWNSILRGAVMGAIMSVSISFYGGAQVFIPFGMIYGAITDYLATRLGS
jgi:Mg/Co/Ni transporter MgtE